MLTFFTEVKTTLYSIASGDTIQSFTPLNSHVTLGTLLPSFVQDRNYQSYVSKPRDNEFLHPSTNVKWQPLSGGVLAILSITLELSLSHSLPGIITQKSVNLCSLTLWLALQSRLVEIENYV